MPETAFTYLASPYTHPDPAVREARYWFACEAAAKLMLAGRVVFCPIAHSHPISERMPDGCAIDADLWKKQDAPYVALCSDMVVLMLDGWKESKGVTHELAVASTRGIPIEFMEPWPTRD